MGGLGAMGKKEKKYQVVKGVGRWGRHVGETTLELRSFRAGYENFFKIYEGNH